MINKLKDFGGIILFYFVIVVGVLLLNLRFSHLNSVNYEENNETYIAMNN